MDSQGRLSTPRRLAENYTVLGLSPYFMFLRKTQKKDWTVHTIFLEIIVLKLRILPIQTLHLAIKSSSHRC